MLMIFLLHVPQDVEKSIKDLKVYTQQKSHTKNLRQSWYFTGIGVAWSK